MQYDLPEEEQAYEARLQRRLQILKNQFEAGKIHIAEGLQVIESLERVRYAADGTVDLTTVDASVRSMALAVEAMHDREQMKKSASLAEIQTTYFEFLNKNFSHFFKVMIDRGLTPHDAAVALSRTPSAVAELNRNLKDFLHTIEEFWGYCRTHRDRACRRHARGAERGIRRRPVPFCSGRTSPQSVRCTTVYARRFPIRTTLDTCSSDLRTRRRRTT